MTRPAVEHIRREPLPWRPEDESTECGRPVSEFASVITRDQAVAKFKDLGMTRATMTTCLTCAETTRRHATWATDPIEVLNRFTGQFGRWTRDTQERERLTSELRALAMLAAAHHDEFVELVAGLAGAVDLSEARVARRLRKR